MSFSSYFRCLWSVTPITLLLQQKVIENHLGEHLGEYLGEHGQRPYHTRAFFITDQWIWVILSCIITLKIMVTDIFLLWVM